MKEHSGNAEPRLGPSVEPEAKLGLGAPRRKSENAPMGWHSRGYVPHFDSFGVMHWIAFASSSPTWRRAIKQGMMQQLLRGRIRLV
ncbi:MAG: hypothetical protein HY788_12360 [Deltaproteobacteria bacterium]|nr:hypothetical protein [Deltaproteobacteria bacterium]